MWYPFPQTDDERKRLCGAEISDEEYDARFSAYMRKCQLDGLKAIGYNAE